jgi:hypothetical protein
MRSAIKDLLDLDEAPTWRELADGLSAAIALVVFTAAVYLGSIAMGVNQ